jgi:hypothetical protein
MSLVKKKKLIKNIQQLVIDIDSEKSIDKTKQAIARFNGEFPRDISIQCCIADWEDFDESKSTVVCFFNCKRFI